MGEPHLPVAWHFGRADYGRVGFIIGGFCPTTSLASASTGKIDGMFFMLGGFVGAFLFGETERYFTYWHNNVSYYGRLTLMDVFSLPAGASSC